MHFYDLGRPKLNPALRGANSNLVDACRNRIRNMLLYMACLNSSGPDYPFKAMKSRIMDASTTSNLTSVVGSIGLPTCIGII